MDNQAWLPCNYTGEGNGKLVVPYEKGYTITVSVTYMRI